MPEVPKPEDLAPAPAIPPEVLENCRCQKVQRWLSRMGPFEFRHIYPRDELNPSKRPPYQQVWFRLSEKVGDAPELHRALLAYASDFHLLGTATFPHGISYYQPGVADGLARPRAVVPSPVPRRRLAVVRHRQSRPRRTRGLARGLIYDRAGRLVASTVQEGMIRVAEAALP